MMMMKRSKLSTPSEGVESLPPDTWQSIFNRLNSRDLKAVSLTCKFFWENSNLIKESLNVVHPKVSMLSQHLKRFTRLKNLHLSESLREIDESLYEVSRSNISLESLEISPHCVAPFKIESLRDLDSNPKMKKSLKALSFKLYGSVRDSDDLRVINSFPNLEELNVYISSPVTSQVDNGIEFLASELRLLKRIHISGTVSISDRSLLALSVNCAFLKDVTIHLLGSDYELTENGIGLLLRNRPNLEALSIGYIKKDPSSAITIANSISHAKALTSLEFINMNTISDELLMAIANTKLHLESFKIRSCNNFTVSSLSLALSNQLTKLSISRYNFADEELKLLFNGDVGNLTRIEISSHLPLPTSSTLFLLLSKCPSLVEISMQSTKSSWLRINNGEVNIPLSSKYPDIRNLRLERCKISDKLTKQFGLLFPNIRVLDLSYCDFVTSTGIEAILKSCKFITKLILTGYERTKIIEVETSELSEVNLEVLKLPYSQIDDEGLAVIAMKCRKLLDLDLTRCRNVTTEGVKQMVRDIKTLTSLQVRNCSQVNRAGLLEWMLSTGNLASLKKISIGQEIFPLRRQFLQQGCFVTY